MSKSVALIESSSKCSEIVQFNGKIKSFEKQLWFLAVILRKSRHVIFFILQFKESTCRLGSISIIATFSVDLNIFKCISMSIHFAPVHISSQSKLRKKKKKTTNFERMCLSIISLLRYLFHEISLVVVLKKNYVTIVVKRIYKICNSN